MYIKSSELNNLGEYTKSLINDGVYYLFKASKFDSEFKYILKTSNEHFIYLSGQGEFVSEQDKISEEEIGEYVYFEDMAVPTTGISLNLNIA